MKKISRLGGYRSWFALVMALVASVLMAGCELLSGYTRTFDGTLVPLACAASRSADPWLKVNICDGDKCSLVPVIPEGRFHFFRAENKNRCAFRKHSDSIDELWLVDTKWETAQFVGEYDTSWNVRFTLDKSEEKYLVAPGFLIWPELFQDTDFYKDMNDVYRTAMSRNGGRSWEVLTIAGRDCPAKYAAISDHDWYTDIIQEGSQLHIKTHAYSETIDLTKPYACGPVRGYFSLVEQSGWYNWDNASGRRVALVTRKPSRDEAEAESMRLCNAQLGKRCERVGRYDDGPSFIMVYGQKGYDSNRMYTQRVDGYSEENVRAKKEWACAEEIRMRCKTDECRQRTCTKGTVFDLNEPVSAVVDYE
ncbi:MAG: hypothetical protein LBE62_09740 [Azonexus sp.]|jgi:hypothetical protein|nr:hypothetical protein [Azonexus sp.]